MKLFLVLSCRNVVHWPLNVGYDIVVITYDAQNPLYEG